MMKKRMRANYNKSFSAKPLHDKKSSTGRREDNKGDLSTAVIATSNKNQFGRLHLFLSILVAAFPQCFFLMNKEN
jgi:hypothetical protein